MTDNSENKETYCIWDWDTEEDEVYIGCLDKWVFFQPPHDFVDICPYCKHKTNHYE